MNRTNKPALRAIGLIVGAISATASLPATAANLVAHYPVDDYFQLGIVPFTTNFVAGSPLPNGQMNYSDGALYGGSFVPALFGNGYRHTIQNQSFIDFGTADPFSWTGSFTYMLWVYNPFPAAGPVQNLQTMVLSKQLANQDHYFRFIIRDNNTIQIGAYYGPTGSGTFQDRNTLSITNVAPDPREKWTHFAFTGSLSGNTATWGVYVNGQPLGFVGGLNTATLDSSRAGIRMRLGATAGNQPQGYPNFIHDDIRFYDGVLTAEEIRAIVAAAIPPLTAAVTIAENTVTISWASFPSYRYQVKKTSDLASATWTNVGGPVTATAFSSSISEPLEEGSAYYRVEVLP